MKSRVHAGGEFFLDYPGGFRPGHPNFRPSEAKPFSAPGTFDVPPPFGRLMHMPSGTPYAFRFGRHRFHSSTAARSEKRPFLKRRHTITALLAARSNIKENKCLKI